MFNYHSSGAPEASQLGLRRRCCFTGPALCPGSKKMTSRGSTFATWCTTGMISGGLCSLQSAAHHSNLSESVFFLSFYSLFDMNPLPILRPGHSLHP